MNLEAFVNAYCIIIFKSFVYYDSLAMSALILMPF